MKSIFRILLFAMAMTAFCASAYAQKDSRQRMTREQLAETQSKYIAQEMAMDGTKKRFGHLAPGLRERSRAGRMRKQNKPLKSGLPIAKRYWTCGTSIMRNIASSYHNNRLCVYMNWKKR